MFPHFLSANKPLSQERVTKPRKLTQRPAYAARGATAVPLIKRDQGWMLVPISCLTLVDMARANGNQVTCVDDAPRDFGYNRGIAEDGRITPMLVRISRRPPSAGSTAILSAISASMSASCFAIKARRACA